MTCRHIPKRYMNSTNSTVSLQDIEKAIVQELMDSAKDPFDVFRGTDFLGNATLEDVLGINITAKPAGARHCQLIVKVGSAFQLGEMDAAFTVGKGSDATSRRYLRAHKEEIDVTIDSAEFSGAVTVKAPQTRLNLRTKSVTAASIDINVAGGIVDLDDVHVHDVAAGINVVVEEDGDIVIAPRGPAVVDLDWKQPCGYVCLPQGYFVDDSQCNVDENGETTTSTTTTTTTMTTTTTITTTTTNDAPTDGGNATNSTEPEPADPEQRVKFQARECQLRTECGSTVNDIVIVGMNATITELMTSLSRHPTWTHYGGATHSDRAGMYGGDDDGNELGEGDSVTTIEQSLKPEADTYEEYDYDDDDANHLHISASVQVGSIYLHDAARAVHSTILEASTGTGGVDTSQNASAANSDGSEGERGGGGGGGQYSMPTQPLPLGAKLYEPELSDKLAYDLAPLLNSSFSEFEDFVYRILLSTFEPTSLWLASTKEVYLQFEPGR